MRAIDKDFLREIKNSRSRFLSIMVLAALAVAFLSGLRATAPDMKRTGDAYLDAYHLQDIQILSPLGITEEDVAALRQAEGVSFACGGYQADGWVDSLTAKLVSLTDGVNEPVLLDGRMPQTATECLLDAELIEAEAYAIGDTLHIVPGGSYADCLRYEDYTIVGAVRSPYYISPERGSGSIGSGTVDGFVYLESAAFDMDCFTVCYLHLAGAEEMTAFYEDYNDFVDDAIDSLTPLGEKRADIRYREIVDEATEKLDDAEQELADAKADAYEELRDAEQELADGRKELDEGWQEYYDGEQELLDAYEELTQGEIDLADAYEKLIDGEEGYAEGLAEFEDGEKEYEDGLAEYRAGKRKLDEAYAQLVAGEQQLKESIAPLGLSGAFTEAEAEAALSAARSQLAGGMAECDAGIAKAEAGIPMLEQLIAQYGDPDGTNTAALAEAKAGLAAAEAAKAELQAKQAALAAIDGSTLYRSRLQAEQGRAEYEAGKKELDEAKKQLDEAEEEIADGEKELRDARRELDDGWKEFRDGQQEIAEGWDEYNDGRQELAAALPELEDGEKEYRDGYREYLDGKREADEKIADAEKELADARRKLAEIENGEWYILSRAADPGYTGFGEDADRMANLAKVFPMIFFLVAALVCLTTMTRMVEEERTQIGLMKAMGYRRFPIAKKYLSYGLLPSLSGSLIGLVIGYVLFPSMIYSAWQIMYETPDIRLYQYTNISLFAALAAVGCTTFATLAACLSTLRDVPANLMRPRAPKAGKRVLLERVGFIWKRLNFHQKVTVRNLFRYRKRFFMTIIGIGGCTALMMAGFGIRSSILVTMDTQYGELFRYDAQLTLASGLLEEEKAEIEDYLNTQTTVASYTSIYANSVTAETDTNSQTAYLEVFHENEVEDYLLLRDYETKEPLSLNGSGVLIDQKLSELLQVEVGDSITISSDGRFTATVDGIYENYLAHFIYMSPAAYEHIFSEAPEENSMLLRMESDDPALCQSVLAELLECSGVSSASRSEDTRDVYQNRMERIDFVVVIVILCAAALAVVVLYNLSSINITERRRELATLKVLGFHDLEVTAYVVRENVVLTLIGVALGCVMGKFLHHWLILSVEIDLMMFGRTLDGWSYLFSSVLTVAFSALVNLMAHRSMKKIDMVESLKSAE